MRERPILMSAPMVRALLAGTKTQTRRIVRSFKHPIDGVPVDCVKDWDGLPSRLDMAPRDWEICPYGVPGDVLWVKETWRPRLGAVNLGTEDMRGICLRYEADGAESWVDDDLVPYEWNMPKAAKRGNVTPLFMPRWASRIDLEITQTRIERLDAITEEDAKAEGVTPFVHDPEGDCWTARPPNEMYRSAFEYLWGEINGWEGERKPRAPWSSNPWLWVLEFKRLEAGKVAA